MAFTWQEIRDDWLDDGEVALSEHEVAEAYNTVEAWFGRPWMQEKRQRADGVMVRGSHPTLEMVLVGRMLAVAARSANSQGLIDKLREGHSSVEAELLAALLVSEGFPDVQVEFEPQVEVQGKPRMPDFRVRLAEDPPIYVEVTAPDRSAAAKEVLDGLHRLTEFVSTADGSFSIEVFLRRDPTAEELDGLAEVISDRACQQHSGRLELSDDLGFLYCNQQTPGSFTVEDHDEPYVPRLGRAQIAGNGADIRQVAARWPITDARAAAILETEARQLPTDAPGLVMIQIGRAVGAMREWPAMIQRRFQPNINTRISAACLFSSGLVPTDDGEEWQSTTKLLINPHARHPLPDWIRDQLSRHAAVDG